MSKVILTGRYAKRPRASQCQLDRIFMRVRGEIYGSPKPAPVESSGAQLAVEALWRNAGDLIAAESWLLNTWRSAPDADELAIRTEALAQLQRCATAQLQAAAS